MTFNYTRELQDHIILKKKRSKCIIMILRFWLIIAFLFLNSVGLYAQDKINTYQTILSDRVKMVVAPPLIKTFFSLALDCPLENVIIKKQITQHPYASIIWQTYNQTGIKGFYYGFWARFLGVVGKNFYSWPAYTLTPYFFQSYFPNAYSQIYGAHELCSSLAIAFLSMISTPLERLRTLKITQPNKYRLSHLWGISLQELYRGSLMHFQYSFLDIYSFLMLEKAIRSQTKKIAEKPNLAWTHFAFIGTSLALIQTALTTPLMTIRVNLQAHGFHISKELKKNSFDVFKERLKQGGIKSLYGGWQARWGRCAFTFSLDSFLIDRIEYHTQGINRSKF